MKNIFKIILVLSTTIIHIPTRSLEECDDKDALFQALDAFEDQPPDYNKALHYFSMAINYPRDLIPEEYYLAVFHYGRIMFEGLGLIRPDYALALEAFTGLTRYDPHTVMLPNAMWLRSYFYMAQLYDPNFMSNTPKKPSKAVDFFLKVLNNVKKMSDAYEKELYIKSCFYTARLAQKDPTLLFDGASDIIRLYQTISTEASPNQEYFKIRADYELAAIHSLGIPGTKLSRDYPAAIYYYVQILRNKKAQQYPKTLNRSRINLAGMLARGEGQKDNCPDLPKALSLYNEALGDPQINFFQGDHARAQVGAALIKKCLTQKNSTV